MKALVKSALALTALLTAFGQPASAARVTWNMAGPLPESNFLTQNLRFFVKRVDELSKGEFKINLHVANALVKDQETKQAVRAGQVPIAEMYVYVYGNENPIFDASTLPFIAGTGEKAFKLWMLTKPYVESLLARQHIKLLYTTPWPMQGFYTNKPITSMDDFKGLKSRVYSTKTARLAQLMGAEPVQVVMSEIAQAFATGLVQTMYTSPQAGVQSQAWDFAKYLHLHLRRSPADERRHHQRPLLRSVAGGVQDGAAGSGARCPDSWMAGIGNQLDGAHQGAESPRHDHSGSVAGIHGSTRQDRHPDARGMGGTDWGVGPDCAEGVR